MEAIIWTPESLSYNSQVSYQRLGAYGSEPQAAACHKSL
jgi:hypothetical protein